MTVEITFDRKFQIGVGGSLALSLAPQELLNKENYLNHISQLLNDNAYSDLNKLLHLQYFYESFVISLLSYLEYITGDSCDEIALVMNQKIKIKHINERSKFESSSTYLKLLIGEKFPSADLNSRLKKYRKVRNILIHNAGLNPKKNEDIQALSKMKGIVEEDEIFYITKEFCREMLHFASFYINELSIIAQNVSKNASVFTKKS